MEFENYTIRLLTVDDALAYFQLIERNRKRLEDFFAGTVSKNKDFEATQKFMLEVSERMNQRTYFPYIVINRLNNEIAGFIDIKNIDWNIPKAELGCFIDEEYAAKGISSQALSIIISHLFNELNFEKLFLRTHQDNIASRRLAEKCGFEVEGIIRKDYKTTQGELVDLMYYGKLR
jgi:RimJ/RimL family protein N-acetyltransferase